MKTDFSEKNARRARLKAADPGAYRAGRRARKAFARGGAFGHMKKAHIVAACSVGTTAGAREFVELHGGVDAEG